MDTPRDSGDLDRPLVHIRLDEIWTEIIARLRNGWTMRDACEASEVHPERAWGALRDWRSGKPQLPYNRKLGGRLAKAMALARGAATEAGDQTLSREWHEEHGGYELPPPKPVDARALADDVIDAMIGHEEDDDE